ncbi:MAG: hypothetical protein RR942_18315 [Romboutsia sp.]
MDRKTTLDEYLDNKEMQKKYFLQYEQYIRRNSMLNLIDKIFSSLNDGDILIIAMNDRDMTFRINNKCSLEFQANVVMITRDRETIYIPEGSILYLKKVLK